VNPDVDDPFADGGAAPERTQLAWHRTALALMGCAALAARLLTDDHLVPGVAASALLAVLAVMSFAGGALPPHLRPTQSTKIAALAYGSALAAVVMMVAAASRPAP
jgi:uncharacterized membrane protein YidH (DUF202 family)